MDQPALSDPIGRAGAAERESPRRLRSSVIRTSEKAGKPAGRADRSPLTRGPF